MFWPHRIIISKDDGIVVIVVMCSAIANHRSWDMIALVLAIPCGSRFGTPLRRVN